MKSMKVAAVIAMLMLAAGTSATRAESGSAEAAGTQEAHNANAAESQPDVVCRKEYRAGTKIKERVCYKKPATEAAPKDENPSGTNQ